VTILHACTCLAVQKPRGEPLGPGDIHCGAVDVSRALSRGVRWAIALGFQTPLAFLGRRCSLLLHWYPSKRPGA
jgi:hypothetical protein